jgi:hypothetical protein
MQVMWCCVVSDAGKGQYALYGDASWLCMQQMRMCMQMPILRPLLLLLFLQVRCVDKGTGDMLVRYTMAAQGALVVLRQLLAACRVEPGSGEGRRHIQALLVLHCPAEER